MIVSTEFNAPLKYRIRILPFNLFSSSRTTASSFTPPFLLLVLPLFPKFSREGEFVWAKWRTSVSADEFIFFLVCRSRMTTTYGTIPTSSSEAPNLEYISRAKERLTAGLGMRRPWREMFNFQSFRLPLSFNDAIGRIRINVAYFLMNYAIVVLSIVFLSLLWHPISLIVFIVMMAVWLFLYFLRDEPLIVFSRTIDDRVVLVILSILTLVFLLLTHATLNILVSLLTGVVAVAIHAALRKTDDLFLDEEEAAATGSLLTTPDVASSSS